MPYGEWTAETLDEQSADAFFKATKAHQQAMEEAGRAHRRLGFVVGVYGIAAGLLGIGAGLVAYVKTPVPPPPGYIFIDRSDGAFFNPISANAVAAAYPESVRRKAIRDFIVACESYIPQTWATIDFHACMIMASPNAQKQEAADIGKNGERYPPAMLGADGLATIERFSEIKQGGVKGSGASAIYAYNVRYVRAETAHNRQTLVPWSAQIVFEFRPDMGINADDRLINPSGLQVISFSTVRD